MLKKKYNWDGKREYGLLGSDQQEDEPFEDVLLGPLEERVFVMNYSF